ncbi:natural product biosynthesis luciferase-like monooxygenase protein [Archangium gephyra]|uniref:Natural product biosynthesis luciferase-like monooxygenase protein n=1 Tax=Archangium gephyra TaxID=48 RepID=A0AAC8TI93_9BACT|nr:MupA/Atu3671 family FMN-dependent luciferase-like monooxygenase [Archangium gephyra]AKJ06585.1 Non-ribosomal peptide synthetase [Archangium gephyra]REG32104.1 natural product biosynthesis luciferase-like monooxygenase protein [Archangium gephyra]
MKNVQDVYRLSPVQRELLSRASASEARPAQLHWSFRQGLDEAALTSALRQLLIRHTALRTAFFAQGMNEPVQVVREKVEPRLEQRTGPLAAFLEEDRRRDMNPANAPLLRVTVLRDAPDMGTVVLTYHPLVLDEDSAQVCLRELMVLYRAARDGSEPVLGKSRPHRDFMAWFEQQDAQESERRAREPLQGARCSRIPEAWRVTRREDPHPGPLPEGEGMMQRFLLSPTATAHVQAFLRQHTLELSTLLQAAWAVLLQQQGQGNDLLFGTFAHGLPAALTGGGPLVGRFSTLVPRRLQVPSRGTLLRWLRGLQAEHAETHASDYFAPSQFQSWLEVPPEDLPLFDSIVTTGTEDEALGPLARSLGFHGLTHELAALPAPLVIRAEQGPRLELRFHYDPGQLASTAVAHAAAHLGTLLEELALRAEQEPSALSPPPEMPENRMRGSITGGTRFGAAEVQAVLARHPAVARVSVLPDASTPGSGALVARVEPVRPATGARKKPGFGLFFFANEGAGTSDKYRLYLDGARFADRNGFTAIWTPERHFDEHGGLYPNPSVLSAALSTITERIGLRSGSVVLPLHSPFRVAEEWSVIDNLSKGRVGLSVTSGWMPNDFALAPDHFEGKREVLFRSLEQVRELWRGGAVSTRDGAGNEVQLRTFPRPVQPELPVWLTCPGNPELFEKAGELGLNVLTSLASQPVDEVREKIALYRAARERAGHDPAAGTVSVMLHTFVGRESGEVLDRVRGPLTHYLRTHLRLQQMRVRSLDIQMDIDDPKWLDSLATFAFEQHYRMSALIGTPTSCLPMVDRLMEAGADELACFIDFGVAEAHAIEGLTYLAELKELANDEALRTRRVLAEHLDERLPGKPPVTFEIH